MGWDQYVEQEPLYRDVPEDLVRLVRNRPPNNESSNVTDRETGERIHSACGVFWFDDEQWRVAEGLLDHCDQTGIDPMIGPGFDYSPAVYRFGHDFLTPESVVEDQTSDWLIDADEGDDLAVVRRIFARYG
ncbi:hypothetical protein ABZ793_25875 [Micromonospora sp. NPDC047465]|uniref:hypothetical protein n=1 Tax=Micromonospora sp. NPDC047465 TaxID=3154813 RepID=UPI0033CF0F72